VDYHTCINRINPHITTGEAAYTRNNTGSMYDAMPALWKNLAVEERQDVLAIIDAAGETNQWTNKELLLNLSRFVELKNVPKLCICHEVAKRDPSVIVGARVTTEDNDDDDETNSSSQIKNNAGALVPQNSAALVPYNHVSNNTNQSITSTSSSQTTLTTFTLEASHPVEKFDTATDKDSACMEISNHMVILRNRNSYKEEKQEVSSYLACEYTDDQQQLSNPSVLDTVIRFIMLDSQGEGAKRRLPQRRLNFIDGTVSSHCGVLNSNERLQLI